MLLPNALDSIAQPETEPTLRVIMVILAGTSRYERCP